jgi:DNA-binding IclR family transcriptional regulator
MRMETPARPGRKRPTPRAGELKSGRRVLDLLEFFAEAQRPATVTEVAARLGWPQSSTSALLATLASLGYLDHPPGAPRQYRPTLRVTLLGSWLQDSLFGWGSLLSVMEALRRETGATVMLGVQHGIHVRYVLVLRGRTPSRSALPAGTLRPIHRAALGKALLAGKPEAEVLRLLRRANAEQTDPAQRVAPRALLEELAQVRAQGWAVSEDVLTRGVAALAVPLTPGLPGQPPMAVGLGGHATQLRAQRDVLVEALRRTCLGLAASLRQDAAGM